MLSLGMSDFSKSVRLGLSKSVRLGLAGLIVVYTPIDVGEAAPRSSSGLGSSWGTIHNKRFGFSIAYPAEILFPIDTPSGAEGRVLQSKDGKAKLLVATFENSEATSLQAYRDYLLGSTYAEAKIDYKPLKARWFVLSGTRGESTIYERVTFSCGGKLINSWAMVYPTVQSKLYDRVVEAISKTYSAGAGVDGTCRGVGDIAGAGGDAVAQ
jgi:hypothetical protein